MMGARTMTLLTLPGGSYSGVMDHGEVAPSEIIAMARRWATQQKAEAEECLAASDDDFKIEIVEGVHIQRHKRLIQPGRAADTYPSDQVRIRADA